MWEDEKNRTGGRCVAAAAAQLFEDRASFFLTYFNATLRAKAKKKNPLPVLMNVYRVFHQFLHVHYLLLTPKQKFRHNS